MRSFLTALSFLSVIPVGRNFMPKESEIKNAANYFPAVGVVFGVIFYLAAWGMLQICTNKMVVAAVLILGVEFLTKCFHLDGLADTADGFLSSRPKERKLEIMHDSHIGTMGVFAIFGLLLLKFVFLTGIKAEFFPAALFLSLMSARSMTVFYIAFSKYARPDGLGASQFIHKPWCGMVCGFIFVFGAAYFFMGVKGLILGAALLLGTWIWSRITHWVIGGATGDTIGAGEELAELLVIILIFSLQ